MKIGEAIQAFNRSTEEEERILRSVINEMGKPAEIYSVYSPTCENESIWVKAQKILKVTGFRPGKAKALILSRVKTGIKNKNTKLISIFWMLYFNCVVTYLRKEHPNLNQLLLERDLESDPDSTVKIISAIKNVAILYEVTDSQIEDIYECYWFDRVDDFRSLLKQSKFDVGLVKELILASEKKQLKAVSNLEKKLKSVGISTKLQEEISSLRKSVSDVTSKIDHLKEDFELESTKIEKSFVEIVDVRISNLEKKQINSLDSEKKKKIEAKISENQESINRLNNKIEKLTAEKEKKKLVRKISFVNDPTAFSLDVRHLLNEDKFTVEHAHIIKDIIVSNGAFYLNSEDFFFSTCSKLINEGRVKEIVLTPSRLEFTDDELGLLLDYEAIYLKNISSGFIEGAVLPLVIKSNSIVDNNFPKVFLEYDQNINPSIEALIRKSTLDLSIEAISKLAAIDIENGISGDQRPEISDITRYYSEVHKVLNNTGIYLEREVYERLISLGQLLTKYIHEDSALPLALRIVAIPYIESRFGKTKSQVTLELINGIISG